MDTTGEFLLSPAIDDPVAASYGGVAMVHPLLQYRQVHRLSRRRLAARLGCSTRTLARWEKGQYCPRLRFALRAQQVTGVAWAALGKPDQQAAPAGAQA